MNPERDEQLERLISRFLDGEAGADERRALNSRVDADPSVRALLDEYAAIDREAGYAMRRALGRRMGVRHVPRWVEALRPVLVAAAACLAVLVWISPQRPPAREAAPARGSLFAPPDWGDRISPASPLAEIPHAGRRDRQQDWIVIPSDRPGEYLLIQVERTRTRAVPIHRDY